MVDLHDSGKRPGQGKLARDLNGVTRYTMFSAFALTDRLPSERGELAAELELLPKRWSDDDVVVRGWYHVAGLRADADVLLWTHGPSVDVLQTAYNDVRASEFGRFVKPFWSNVAVHQPAECNKSHVPAFLAGERERAYVCVYPFVRSYEWYLLPEEERRALLMEHGMMARTFPDVRANTVSSFALGDYEWLLAFEADDLHRIVELMRHLRGSATRRHVREEVPFFTGPRRSVAELVAGLP
jgi:hydrogen peroxide-dependent heme synthase